DSHLPTPPVSPPPTAPPAAEAASEESDPYVPFTIQIRLSTYLKLRQAYHWEPGFGEMREHVNEAMATYLAQLPGCVAWASPACAEVAYHIGHNASLLNRCHAYKSGLSDKVSVVLQARFLFRHF
nr:hypothetical protein [Tanacetum cinerariifolium]